MLKFKTREEHAAAPFIKNIPWSIFSDPYFFNCKITKQGLMRLQGSLEESSQKPESEERPICAILSFLFGHREETDQILCETIRKNAGISDFIVLKAIVATGRASLLKCFIQSMPLQNREKITNDALLDVTRNAINQGDIAMLDAFEELIPSLITKFLHSIYGYCCWEKATSNGHLEMLKYFEKKMQPDAVKEIISQFKFSLYAYGLANPNQLSILHYFESFVECTPEEMILSRNAAALNNALSVGQQDIINYFLAYPRVFAVAEKKSHPKIDQFIQFQLERWYLAEEERKKMGGDQCFSSQEIELAMLFVRRYIREDSFLAHENLRKLLRIESIAKHMHSSFFPTTESDDKEPNGLLQLALTRKNISMAKCLLSLPAVRALAKEQNYYQKENTPSIFAIEAYANKCDEQAWTGVNDLESSMDEDCIYRLYQMSKTMIMSEPGRFVCPESATLTFFQGYSRCAREAPLYHSEVLSHLFSSRYGLMKLFALLRQGLCISYAGNDHQKQVDRFHWDGQKFNRTPENQKEQQDFECFSKHLDTFITPNASNIIDAKATDFFHAALLKNFINTYIHFDQTLLSNTTKTAKEAWYNLLKEGNFQGSEYFYILMRIGGFQLYQENFKMFARNDFFNQSAAQTRAICDFFLNRYTDKFKDTNTSERSSKIAANMAKKLLKNNFSLNIDDIKAYHLIYRLKIDYNISELKQLKALSMAYFIKLAGLLAIRFEQYAFLDVLIQLSKELGPVYRYYNALSLNQHLMPHPGIAVSMGKMSTNMINHGEFQNALTDILSLFHSPEQMDEFCTFLDNKLKLQHVPSIPSELIQKSIHFFEISYLGKDAYDWYLSLTSEQRKLNQALHLVLLEWERENGYNLEKESTGDVVPRFYGFVDSDYANNLLLAGYLFKESPNYLPGILHGVNSHRIQWAIITFYIARGIIRLPEGKTVHDLLAYVINNKLWSELVDSFHGDFRGPHFVASWLRASKYPNIQKAMIMGDCKRIDKFLQSLPTENNPWNYERLIMMQSCFEEQFSTMLPRIKPDNTPFPMQKYSTNDNGLLDWGVYTKDTETIHQILQKLTQQILELLQNNNVAIHSKKRVQLMRSLLQKNNAQSYLNQCYKRYAEVFHQQIKTNNKPQILALSLELKEIHTEKEKNSAPFPKNKLQERLAQYQNCFWITKQRKNSANTLQQQIKEKITYKDILNAIVDARNDVLHNDATKETGMHRFGKSRYYETLNEMEELLVHAWISDPDALHEFTDYVAIYNQERDTAYKTYIQALKNYAPKNYQNTPETINEQSDRLLSNDYLNHNNLPGYIRALAAEVKTRNDTLQDYTEWVKIHGQNIKNTH